jgi:hypothetical protein
VAPHGEADRLEPVGLHPSEIGVGVEALAQRKQGLSEPAEVETVTTLGGHVAQYPGDGG